MRLYTVGDEIQERNDGNIFENGADVRCSAHPTIISIIDGDLAAVDGEAKCRTIVERLSR